ncbi:MAG: hypothetical protein J1F05_04150 [Muribaculaceae bacterium]|nr:hypothetical protein [Muribaculaceae bacterium]
MKNITNIIKRTLCRLSLILIVGMMAGCADDLSQFGPETLGEKVHGTLSVPLNAPSATVVSRQVSFADDAVLKLDTYWLGLYDTETGELIGSSHGTPRKADGSRYTFNGSSNTYTVENVEIYYYDQHPEAYVVGVVNHSGVKAKVAGSNDELTDLLTLLESAKTWNDFCKISIDTESANRANPNESDGYAKMPLMMGFYTTDSKGAHPTVKGWDNDAVTQGNAKIRLVKGSDNHSEVGLQSGAIRLMRLISEVSVQVVAAPNVTLSNVQYKVVNNPKEVYLVEHATDTRGPNISSDKSVYDARSANSADYTSNYTSNDYWLSAPDGRFSYQQYENKHWGDASWIGDMEQSSSTAHLIREKRLNSNRNLYQTLCLDRNHPWNNNASYFVIKADVEVENSDGGKISGTIEYTIHEGYTSTSNGLQTASGIEATLDYQRTRNTLYYYNIGIVGIDKLTMQATAQPMDDVIHNDGITGSVGSSESQEIGGYGTNSSGVQLRYVDYDFFNNLHKNRNVLQWRYYITTPTEELNYGVWPRDKMSGLDWPAVNTEMIEDCPAEILNTFKFYIRDSYSRKQGYYQDGGWIESGMVYVWTLEDLLNAEKIPVSWEDGHGELTYYISIPRWETGARYRDFPEYRRGFYFGVNQTDADGCSFTYFRGYLQEPYDDRSYPNGMTPYTNDNNSWYSSEFDGYTLALNTVGFVRWYVSEVWYLDEEHEIDTYEFQLEDNPPIIIDRSYKTEDVWRPYFTVPIDPNELGVGEHTFSVRPIVDEDYVRPATPTYFTITVHDSYWTFDDITWPILTEWYYLENGTRWTYFGLTFVCSTGGSAVSMSRGSVYTAGTGSFDNRSFQFTVTRPGRVVVEATVNATASNNPRGVYLSNGVNNVMRDMPWEERGVKKTLTFDTSELYSNGEDISGATTLAIYSLNNLYINSIRFIPD